MTSLYDLNLCCQCDEKFLMPDDGELCHKCLLKRDAFHYQRGLSDARAWIKCSDRLPQHRDVILAVNKEGEMAVCRIDINVNNYIFMLADTSLQIKNVTHWQLLPEPPEDE